MIFEDLKKSTCLFCEENLIRDQKYLKCADRLADHQLEIDCLNKQAFITVLYNKYVIKLDFLDNRTTFARGREKLFRDYIIDFSSIEDLETFAVNNFNKWDIFK